MLHEMKLQDKPFNSIKIGEKTYELRLYDEKRRKISAGDKIEFTNMLTQEKIMVEVIALHVYNNFTELFRDIPKTKIGYKENEEALPQDMEKYYSLEEQEKYNELL